MNTDKTIERIKTLIKKLEEGGDVSISSMNRVLTPNQISQFNEDWIHEKLLRKMKKPIEAIIYEKKIKVACLHYQKMEKFSLNPNKARMAREFSNKADDAFEKAYEFLLERLQANNDLRMWLDRDPDPSKRCPIGIPRIIGSSSFECQMKNKTPYPTLTKKELKLRALESALEELTRNDLEAHCEPIKIVHFSRSKNIDFSSFRF